MMHGENKPREISRRDMLKRGGLVVGAAVWMTPAIQVLNMTPAGASEASSVPGYGSEIGSTPSGSEDRLVPTEPRKRERKGDEPPRRRENPGPPDPRED